RGNDFKRTTSHGRVKDYSNSGGYRGAISDFYNKISKTWPKYSELIKNSSFSSDDIDKALYTGKYREWKEQRNKTGHLSYNFDNVDEANKINNNKYGEHVYNQMKSIQQRFISSLDFQIGENEKKINHLTFKTNSFVTSPESKIEF